MSASACNSSRVTNAVPALGNMRLNQSSGMKKGVNIFVIPDNTRPEGAESAFQYAEPSVFGIISERNNTARVNIIEAIVKLSSPNCSETSAPTPAAPIVWAIVLSVRIAVRGFTESSSFSLAHLAPFLSPALLITLTCDSDMESSTASNIEHRNETPNAIDA